MSLSADALQQRDYKTLIESAGVMLPATVRGFQYALENPAANWMANTHYQEIMAALYAASRVPLLVAALNDIAQERALQEEADDEEGA